MRIGLRLNREFVRESDFRLNCDNYKKLTAKLCTTGDWSDFAGEAKCACNHSAGPISVCLRTKGCQEMRTRQKQPSILCVGAPGCESSRVVVCSTAGPRSPKFKERERA
jgi:hypothetical protein